MRDGETVGWIGGSLFAWLLTVNDEFAGWEAAERVRRALREARASPWPRASATRPGTPRRRTALAGDGRPALGKTEGTGVSFRWSPDVVALLSAEKRHGVVGGPEAAG